MSPFQAMNAQVLAIFGQPITYSRPISTKFDAVAPFTANGIANFGGEYATPTGHVIAELEVQVSAIPLGPQKGDLVSFPSSTIRTGSFVVQEIFLDENLGAANLKIRWVGP